MRYLKHVVVMASLAASVTSVFAQAKPYPGDKPITINAAGQADIPSITLPLLGFSPDLRLRWPLLTSKAYPQGILQPYLTAGPAWALTTTIGRGVSDMMYPIAPSPSSSVAAASRAWTCARSSRSRARPSSARSS